MATLTLKPKIRGFSLIELAIILIITGLFISGLLPFTISQINHRKIVETDEKLEDIKNALLGFAIIYGRLPCPASNSTLGIENCGTLSGNEGFLPWADLGIGKQDSWGQPFRYRSDSEYSLSIPGSLKTVQTSTRLKVKDKAKVIDLSVEENYPNDSTPNSYSRIVAIIFSYGKNLAPESENDDLDNIYIQDEYVETFDDRLTWLSKYTLINHLVATNTLPP
jgi:type II secretory pathway pseudopilin PulG